MTFGRKPKCGRCGTCKRCRHAAAERARWRSLTLEERRERIARRNDAEAKARRARARRQDPEYRRKQAARYAVRDALRAGRLVRLPCEECGAPQTQAHHVSYDRPLDVRWRCHDCHLSEHLLPVETHDPEEDLRDVA